nr:MULTISPECIES: 5-bromo-4-chloroindolyl phosphate hydrolysis family protein [Clostridia]
MIFPEKAAEALFLRGKNRRIQVNQDWERWGRDIRDIVQDAVDSQDFQKLNETISNTVNEAIFNLRENIRRRPGGPGPGPGMGPGDPGSFGDPGGFGGPQGSWEGQEYQTGQGNGAFEGGSMGQMRQRRAKPPVLFARKGGISLAGTALLTVGFLFTFACVCTVIAGVADVLVTGFGGAEAGAFFVLACLTAAGVWMFCKGRGMRGRAKRFRRYVEALQGRAYCNISDIAQRTGEKPKRIVKDLRRMIADRWFLQGHLDEQGACLMVTDAAYEEYRRIQQLRREQQQAEAEQPAGQQSGQGGENAGYSPEVQRVLAKGRWYVDKIRECNDAIPGVEISRKIDRIELLVRRIFDRVEADPDAVDDIKKLMEYYLPTTVKLLEAYEQLDAQPEAGENIRQAKEEIEKTLDTLNTAFEKLLDSLFEDVAWDISSDISVLETMLAQEGLTEDGWKRKE